MSKVHVDAQGFVRGCTKREVMDTLNMINCFHGILIWDESTKRLMDMEYATINGNVMQINIKKYPNEEEEKECVHAGVQARLAYDG